MFFVAGLPKEFATFAGQARVKIGNELGLSATKTGSTSAGSSISRCMSGTRRRSGSTSRTIPSRCRKAGSRRSRRKEPHDILAYQYDVVCNGVELSSGAIRNHKPEIMEKAFAIAGYPKEELEKRFGGMLRALQYGAPPHGGIAPGIDRIVMLLCGEDNLRQVVMFPMNQQAEDLLMGAPSEVSPKQLKELHIRVVSAAQGLIDLAALP